MTGHNWLLEIINIETGIKDAPRRGQFMCFYWGKPYKGAKCLYNHKLRCKRLQYDVHMYIEEQMPQRGKILLRQMQ